MNSTTEDTTIAGPDGIAKISEAKIPQIIAILPKNAASAAIDSGLLASFLAEAAGIINIEVISKIPKIWIEIATAIVIKNINKICI